MFRGGASSGKNEATKFGSFSSRESFLFTHLTSSFTPLALTWHSHFVDDFSSSTMTNDTLPTTNKCDPTELQRRPLLFNSISLRTVQSTIVIMKMSLYRVFLFQLLSAPCAFAFFSSSTTSTTSATDIDTPVVICPGFGNDQVDYTEPLQQPADVGLVSVLQRRGFQNVNIVPVQRADWVRVAGGLLDVPAFYTNTALPTGRGYGWYVQRLKATVDQAYETSGGKKVLLLGHSAGGWLARAAMGNGVWSSDSDDDVRTADRICCLATVGAIHRPPVDTNTCVTRGALAYTNREYPGAFLANQGIAYVSVGGNAIVGNDEKTTDEATKTQADKVYAVRGEGSQARVAYTSYKAVCGNGFTSGDGVVPLEWSELPGAKHLSLDGVLHSINEAGTTLPTDRWYGSEGVIDQWLPTVLKEAGIGGNSSPKGAFGLASGWQQWAENAQKAFLQR